MYLIFFADKLSFFQNILYHQKIYQITFDDDEYQTNNTEAQPVQFEVPTSQYQTNQIFDQFYWNQFQPNSFNFQQITQNQNQQVN